MVPREYKNFLPCTGLIYKESKANHFGHIFEILCNIYDLLEDKLRILDANSIIIISNQRPV